MNTYTIYWTPEQQTAFLLACGFIEVAEAVWMEEPEYPHFALVQELNPNQYEAVVAECQGDRIAGIKPGSNPGGSPTGCA
jgi:hypothetical protein